MCFGVDAPQKVIEINITEMMLHQITVYYLCYSIILISDLIDDRNI